MSKMGSHAIPTVEKLYCAVEHSQTSQKHHPLHRYIHTFQGCPALHRPGSLAMFSTGGGGRAVYRKQLDVGLLARFPSLHCIYLPGCYEVNHQFLPLLVPACQAEHLINCLDAFSGPQVLRAQTISSLSGSPPACIALSVVSGGLERRQQIKRRDEHRCRQNRKEGNHSTVLLLPPSLHLY